MGVVYTEKKEYDKAIEMYHKSININPNNDAVYHNMGDIYSEKKEYLKSILMYKKAIEINPNNAEHFFYLGHTYTQKEEYTKALRFYQETVKANPNHSNAYTTMGYIYFAQEEYGKAIEMYSRSIITNTTNDSVFIKLFELKLTQNQLFEQKIENTYIKQFQNQKKIFIQYEMLKIFQDIANGKKPKIEKWKQKYHGVKLTWSFNELNWWIDKYKEEEIKNKLRKAIDFFEKRKSLKLKKNTL